jgi:uncharacterized protein YbjT (DUF2867 family)
MDVVVAGGHGKIGLRLLRLLAERGDRARGLIRNPNHAEDLEAAGAQPVLCDLEVERDVGGCVAGAEAIVFAAGAGPGSGPDRKQSMDLGGAVKLIEAAKANGVARYVMVSSMGAAHPERISGAMKPYIDAKAEADRQLAASGLDYTIVRPGGLTDDPGTGRIRAAPELEPGEVTRDDVAATLAAVLAIDTTIGKAFELREGDTPVEEALRAL